MLAAEKLIAISLLMAEGLFAGWIYRRRGAGARAGIAASLPSLPFARLLHRITNRYVGILLVLSLLPNTSATLLLRFHDDSWLRWTGVGLATGAIALFLWSMRTLGEQYSPCGRVCLPGRIVTAGPYQWLRHPVYVANWLFMLGTMLGTGSMWMLGPLTLYAVAFTVQAIREESQLVASFPEYREYQNRTRWLA